MKLFEAGKIGKMAVKNRIVMSPMGTGTLSDLDMGVSQGLIDYYAARAKGGVGLIVTGASPVTTAIEPPLGTLIDGPSHLSRLMHLCNTVHFYGTKIAFQLSAGSGRTFSPTPFTPLDRELVSASAVPSFDDPSVKTRELTIEEIEILVKAFGAAAGILKAARADAVGIHGYGGYLIDQFQTALWNKRTDKYGGDLDGRLRFSMEIIEAIQKAAGEDFPIIYRFTPVHAIEGGREIEEGLEVCKRLEKAGVAALDVGLGCRETYYRAIPCMYEPPGSRVHIAEAVRGVVKIPVIVDGKLGDPELAEKVLSEGKADFIGLGRPLLADPAWVHKVKQGKLDDIRPCISDLEGCLSRVWGHNSCAVNPVTGMEKEYALTPAEKPKSVLVIGGGAGGMEAAVVAAERGHEVTLWEKSDRLGGSMIAASVPDFKRDIRRFVDYLSTQVRKLGVKIVFLKEASPELVQQVNPEVVIISTGATPLIPEIPGIEKDNVFSAVDLLLGKKQVGKTVVVAGGGAVGCETAVYLAEKGKKVTIVEMTGQLIPEAMNLSNRMGLLNMVGKSQVTVLTGTQLLEVTEAGVIVSTDGSKRELKADSIVLALGFKSESVLRDGLEGKVAELFAIGDCVEPRRILHAIWEGFHTARLI